MVEVKNVIELLKFVLGTEKESYKQNPISTSKEISDRELLYKKKVEEIAQKKKKKEGVKFEN